MEQLQDSGELYTEEGGLIYLDRVIIVSVPIHLNGSCATGVHSPELCDLDVAIFAL